MYKTFLIDDEPWALIELKDIIDWPQYGFEICGEADNGELALSRIEQLRPDLILSDIRMPGLDGLTLLKTLRERNISSSVLLVSGFSEFGYAREALRYGCEGYLLKPVEEEELVDYLKAVRKKLDEAGGRAGEPEREGEDRYTSSNAIVREVMSFIQANYASNISLQDIADHFHVSSGYISGMIKSKTGKNFTEHLAGLRIREAQRLLAETNRSVDSIAETVGYSDYSYFSKVFKKITGMTPAAFRRRL